MNFPDYLRSIWTDPRFCTLDTATKALLYGALSQVDMAGWWAPNPRLVQAEIPGIDLQAASVALRPWIQVHPTGYWSFKGYVAMQCGEGPLNLNSGFAKGVHRVLLVHCKRETGAGALPESIEGLGASPTGGTLPSKDDDEGGHPGATRGAPRGHGSTKSQVPCPKVPSPIVESPTRESEGASSHAGEPSRMEDVLNVFAKMAPVAVLDVKPWQRDALHKAAARWGWDALYGAAGAYFGHGAGARPTLEDYLDKLPKLLMEVCQHPSSSKVWWTFPVDPNYPNGVKRKRWRCGRCGHVEDAVDSDFMADDHVHSYTVQEGPGIVLNEAGNAVSVPAWELCTGPKGCGHMRAPRSREVAA